MKHIAALAAWLVAAAAPPLSPRTLAGTPGGGRDGEVKAVSVLPAAGSVEVVIDLQGTVDVQDFTLANPNRLVIDLQVARLAAPATLYDGQNRGGIRNIRYAQFRPGVVRIVIDLDVLKDYQIEKADGQVRVKIGTERGRKARPGLKVGICGEHGGDPASVAFCHEAKLDYVSCSPFRVPIARLAAAQAALGKTAESQA